MSRPPRIVMAVNNPGSNDARVVRAAEAAARAGYDVQVVGQLVQGYAPLETINGVTYHRVAVGADLAGLAVDLLPAVPARRMLQRRLREPADRGAPAAAQAPPVYLTAPGLGSFSWRRPRDFFPMLTVSLLYRLNKYLFKPLVRQARAAPRKIRHKVLRPTRDALRGGLPSLSALWPRYVQGRYLLAYYPKLVGLAGDVYHAHELPALKACALAAEHLGARLVYDSHELEAHRNALWTPAERRFWTRRERELMAGVAEVITVSYSLAEELKKMHGLGRVTVIRNTPPSRFEAPPAGLRAALGLAGDAPLMVFVGLLTRNRGVDLALQALARLPGYHLATVGAANEQVLREVKALSRRLGASNRFHLHPKVPYRQLVNFLADADLGVIPLKNACLSYYCALPNKLFECVFAGLPVAASDFPDLARFINDNRAGAVFDPEDIADMAAKIRWVYENRRELMPPPKVAALRREHCFEREADKLMALYARLGFPPPGGGASLEQG